MKRVNEVNFGDISLSETEEPQAPQGSNLKRSNEREAETYHDEKRLRSYLTPEFIEKFDKVYAHIMAEEELQRDKVRLYPSSRHVKEYSDSSDISQTSEERHPRKKMEFKSSDLKIKSERYIGRRNRNDDWDDVPEAESRRRSL